MSDLIDRQAAIKAAVRAAIDWHRLANPQYSIAYCIGEAMRSLPPEQTDRTALHDLLQDAIDAGIITEAQAIGIMWRAQHKGEKD